MGALLEGADLEGAQIKQNPKKQYKNEIEKIYFSPTKIKQEF